MPKRTYGETTTTGEHSQEPGVLPKIRKSTRLKSGPKTLTEKRQSQVLPSPSTSGSHRQPLPSVTVEEPATFPNLETEIFPTKSPTAHKRKRDKEQSHFGIKSRKTLQKLQSREISHTFDRSKEPELHRSGLPEKAVQVASKTAAPVTEISERSEKESGAITSVKEGGSNPIDYWTAHHTWPVDFAQCCPMASSSNTSKRRRTSDSSQIRSYSQSRKAGEVPEQYTPAYERFILTKGLDMDVLRGEELISEESRNMCTGLQKITHKTIRPTIFPEGVHRKVMNICQNRNEAMVERDITPMIVPSIKALYFGGDKYLEHVVDEVRTDWYPQCVLAGPCLRPDLAIGFSQSAFTEAEIDKLKRYMTVDNWAQFTGDMYFPFLMVEVKCGTQGLDMADRQNMHSCSVAVRALLKIEREADRYRVGKTFENLNRKVPVFSLSHDQKDVRVYGHYASVQNDDWKYYRYAIKTFNILTNEDDFLAAQNFVRNTLKTHVTRLLKQLKDALAVIPESGEQPTNTSFSVSELALAENDSQQDTQQDSQQDSQDIAQRSDDASFQKPARPPSTARIDRLLIQLEQQRQDHKDKEERMERQMELQRQQMERQMELQKQQIEEQKEIMSFLRPSKGANASRHARDRAE